MKKSCVAKKKIVMKKNCVTKKKLLQVDKLTKLATKFCDASHYIVCENKFGLMADKFLEREFCHTKGSNYKLFLSNHTTK
jgi:hypothetical protein